MQNEASQINNDSNPHSEKGKPSKWEGIIAVFPEDLGIAAVYTFMNHNQQNNVTDMGEDEELPPASQEHPPSTTMIISSQIPPKKFRLNLIRHKHATPTELTTLQLFKAFITMAKKTDKTLIIHPVDLTKQHLTSLISQKQVDSLTPNQLRLYFSSWFKDQSNSISGFIHLSTILTFEELQTKLPLAEWLQNYQYSIALCKSQEEEMSIMGHCATVACSYIEIVSLKEFTPTQLGLNSIVIGKTDYH
jgi:hypothetical protein